MALCEIRVHLLSARDIAQPTPDQTFHTAVVSVPGLSRVSHTSRASERPNDPRWDEVFTFNVPMARLTPDKVVQVEIMGTGNRSCGQATVPLWGLKDSEPHRYAVGPHGGNKCGVVKVGVKVTNLEAGVGSHGEGEAKVSPRKGAPSPRAPEHTTTSKPQKVSNEQPHARKQREPQPQHPPVQQQQQQKQRQQQQVGQSARPALSIVTLDSEVREGPSSSSKPSSRVQAASHPRPTTVVGRSPTVSTTAAPGGSRAMGYPVQGTPQSNPTARATNMSSLYMASSAFPPPVVRPAPMPQHPYGAQPPYGPQPPYGAPPPYGAYGAQGPSLAFGGGGQPVTVIQSQPSGGGLRGVGGMVAGAAVGAGLGVLGGMALGEMLDDDDDYDEDDDF